MKTVREQMDKEKSIFWWIGKNIVGSAAVYEGESPNDMNLLRKRACDADKILNPSRNTWGYLMVATPKFYAPGQ